MKQQASTSGKAVNFKSLVQLWPWLRKSKGLMIIASVMIPVSALVEMGLPLVVQRTVDRGIMQRDIHSILSWAGLYFVLVIASYFCRSLQAITTATAVHRMIFDLRGTLIRHVLHLPAAFHDHELSGALATRATGDFDASLE